MTTTPNSICLATKASLRFLTIFLTFSMVLLGWSAYLNQASAQTTYPVIFRVDMSDYNGTTPINGIYLNGSFNSWCGSCAPMSDANNDSVWELTVPLAADTFEYKFTINGWTAQETLIPGSPCTNTAFGFTNRQIIVNGPLSLPAPCYGSCDSCTGLPSSGRIRFRVDMNGYTGPTFSTVNLNGSFNGWCGSCATMLDPDQDSIYELDLDLPLSTVEYKFTLDGWNQQESLLPGSPCTMTTGQFTNRFHNVTGNDTLDAVCWQSCSPCASGPTSGRILFRVDMNNYSGLAFSNVHLNGTFNNWCGACAPMTDTNLDSIYELELTLPLDTVEYKFTLDGWNISENLNAGLPCTQTTSTFTNRAYIVTGDDSLDAVCWESCSPCFPVGVINGTMTSTTVKAYPNPVEDLLHLDIPRNESTKNLLPLRWFDAQGREVQSLVMPTGSNKTYRVDTLSPGWYSVHVPTSLGVQVVRFFKK
jgi:hypothetical protein